MSVGLIEVKSVTAARDRIARSIARSIVISAIMPVPKEDIRVGGASGRRAASAALRAGFEEAASDIAEPKASHEPAPVAVCSAAAVSNMGRSFPLGADVL